MWLRVLQIAAVSSLALQASAIAETASPRVFDFKGIQLGVTIAEMRSTPIHDEYARDARMVCSEDPEVGTMDYMLVQATDAEKRAGLQRCSYFKSPAERVGLSMAGDAAAYDHEFDFARDADTGETRLFEIVLRTRADATRDVVAALQDRWGPPRVSTGVVQTAFGAQIPQYVYRWQRGESSIIVATPDGSIDMMSVVYQLRPLAQTSHQRVRAEEASTPDRM
jgi:hypothetical protein